MDVSSRINNFSGRSSLFVGRLHLKIHGEEVVKDSATNGADPVSRTLLRSPSGTYRAAGLPFCERPPNSGGILDVEIVV